MHPLVREGDPRELQRSYIAYRMRELWKRLTSATPEGYTLQLEPVSAQFCKYAVATVTGISEPQDPLHYKVHTTVRCELNKIGLRILNRLVELGINPVPYGRSGAGFGGIQNKKLGREVDYFEELQDVRDRIYASVYARNVPRLLDTFFELYQTLTMRNISMAEHNPELLGVGKPLNSGTGYIGKASDRQGMIDTFKSPVGHAFAQECRTMCDQYYGQLRAMVKKWPFRGGIGYIAGPFKGIQGGSRSDVEVVDIQPAAHELVAAEDVAGNPVNVEFSASPFGVFQLESKTREVGNDPSSVFHNHGLTTSVDQQSIWTKFSSEYHIMPSDLNRALTVFTTPPAHMPWSSGEDWVLVSADWGGIDPPAFVQGNRVVIPSAHFTAGAEQVSLKGIFFDLSAGFKLAHLESGTPFTMSHYLITAGEVLAEWARSHGISPDEMWVYQIGDDMHIRIKAKYVELLLADLGHALKLKGMSKSGPWYVVFILGHYYAWKDANTLVTWMMPRALKSVSSANAVKSGSLPQRVLIGHSYLLTPTPEAAAAVADFQARYEDMMLFEGTPEEWRQLCVVDQHFAKMKLDQMTFDSGSGYAMALSESGFNEESLAKLAAEAELQIGALATDTQDALVAREATTPVVSDSLPPAPAQTGPEPSSTVTSDDAVDAQCVVSTDGTEAPDGEGMGTHPVPDPSMPGVEAGSQEPISPGDFTPEAVDIDAVCANFVHQKDKDLHVHKCKVLGMCGYSKECASKCDHYEPLEDPQVAEVKEG